MERSTNFSTVLLAVAVLQSSDCGPPPTGNTQLLVLEFEASGQNRVAGFSPGVLSYDVWAPAADSLVTVRAQPADPGSAISVHYQNNVLPMEVGSGEVGSREVDVVVTPGASSMVVFVTAPGGAGKGYVLDVTHGAAPPPISLGIDLGCNNSALPQHEIIEATLTVAPGALAADAPFTANLGGTLKFPESYLDIAQTVGVGGCQQLDLMDARLTVLARTGATGSPVTLGPDRSSTPSTCLITGVSCDVANNVPGDGNSDCMPQGSFHPCQTLVTIPTTTDLATCQSLDPPGCTPTVDCTKSDKHALFGFCVTGPLVIPLLEQTGQYTTGASGETIRFGLDDQNTAATLSGGLYTMPAPDYLDPVGPNGVKVNECGLSLAFDCLMAVEVGDPLSDPVDLGVTPDSLLVGEGVYVIP